MKKIILILPLLLFCLIAVSAQSEEKKEEKKVVIVKKVTDKNGKVTKERIEAQGAEADKILKEMREKGELEDVDIEITMDKKIVEKKAHKKQKQVTISKSGNSGSSIQVEIDSEEKDGKQMTKLKITEGDGQAKVIEWEGNMDNVPDHVKELLEKENIDINVADGQSMIIVEKDIDGAREIPETRVRMGVRMMDSGILEIKEIDVDSPALEAGLKKGDIITEIDNHYITDFYGLMKILSDKAPGDTVQVRFVRDGKASTTILKLMGK